MVLGLRKLHVCLGCSSVCLHVFIQTLLIRFGGTIENVSAVEVSSRCVGHASMITSCTPGYSWTDAPFCLHDRVCVHKPTCNLIDDTQLVTIACNNSTL